MSRNPFAALAGDDDISEGGDIPLPKQSKPTQVDAAPPKSGAPKSGSINNATTRRHIPGQTVRPQKEARELPPSDAPAGSQAQFDGERGRDDRGTGFGRGRGGRGRGERGAGRGAPRGAGRGGRAERPDRRSQTGREDSAKAEHQGWGGDEGKRELEAETAGLGDAAAEAKEGDDTTAAPKAAETNGDKTAAVEEAATPAEPEDNSLTYEEYLKQRQAANIPGVQQVSARKANEGADETQWKDGVAIEKKEHDPFFAIEGAQKEKARKEKARKEKQFLEVEFSAPARQERGGERGGRGGSRGGRGRGDGAGRGRGGEGRGGPRGGRGAPRGGRSAGGANINVDDNKAFPSLA